jgi:hypothetical protein
MSAATDGRRLTFDLLYVFHVKLSAFAPDT